MATPTLSKGVTKQLAVAAETSFGVQAPGAGQLLRRVSSDLNLNVAEIQSAEILPSQQVRDHRNGPRQVQGTLSAQLAPGAYKLLFENLLRSTFTAPPQATVGPVTDSTGVVSSTGVTLTTSQVNLVPLLRIGDIARFGGLTGAAAVDNAQNARVLGLTASAANLGPLISPTAWAAASQGAATITVPGKKLFTPAVGQLDNSLSFEEFYADISRSELFLGCKVTQISLNIPASGYVTLQASITGQDMKVGTSQVYAGAAAPSVSTGLTAVTGVIMYQGVALGYVTGLNLQIAAQVSADPVVGANIIPYIFNGTLMTRGSLTCFLAQDTLTADFLAENEVAIGVLLTTSPAGNADFISLFMPRVKLIGMSKNDSDRAITRSYNFMALENVAAPISDLSTISIQDSTL